MRKLLNNLMPGLSRNSPEQIAELLEQTRVSLQICVRNRRQKGKALRKVGGPVGLWHFMSMTFAIPESLGTPKQDLLLRATDLSLHFRIFMTIREEPFKNCRSRTSDKRKAKFEEAKKQKIKKTMMDGVMPIGKHHLGHGSNV